MSRSKTNCGPPCPHAGMGMSTVANGERLLQMTEVHSLGTVPRRKDDTQDALRWGGHGEPFTVIHATNADADRETHTHTHRERDTNNTQTCGEHLKGLNKLFISGVGFWRRQNAMAGGREKKRERGDRVGKRGNSQANICEKPPNSSRGAGTWNVLNATLRVTFAECECHFACCSFHSPTLATLLYAVLSLPLSLSLSRSHVLCVFLTRHVKNMLFHKLFHRTTRHSPLG